MTANYTHEENAGLSPNNSRKDLCHASNNKSLQQFQENNKRGRSVAMDYEVILYSQTEQDGECSIPKIDWNEKDSNDNGNGELVCDDHICSTACDKDVDYDMGVKDCSDSGIDKGEDCGVDLKLQEESDLNNTTYEISQSQSGFPDGADIESEVDYEIVRKHKEDCEKIEANNSNESSRDNSKLSNVDCDKMDNLTSDEQCDDSNMPNQKSSVDNFLENDDDFDITSVDSDEEFQLEIRHKLLFLGGDKRNKTSKLKPQVNHLARKAAENGKFEILSKLAEHQVNDLNLQQNKHFVQHLEKDDNIPTEVFCLHVSQDSTNIRSRKQNLLECDKTLSSSEHSPHILSSDFLNDSQADSTTDWDIDLLTPSEKNLEENVSNDSKCQVVSSVFLSQHSNSNSLQLDDLDNIDGMCPAHSNGPSSYFQSVNNEALSAFTQNPSVSNRLVVPSSKVLDNNVMLTSSDPVDSNSNHIINSIIESKTDHRTYSVVQDCMPISAEYVCKTETVDSSRNLQHDQKSKSCSDKGIALAKYNLSSARVDTLSSESPLFMWPAQRRPSTSGSQHISDHPKKKLNVNYLTQCESANGTKIPTAAALPRMGSTDLLIDWVEEDGSTTTAIPTQKLQVPSHSHKEEVTQQHILPNINAVRDNTVSILSTSAFSPEIVKIATAYSLETTERFSTTENVPSAKSNSIPLLFQASVSLPSPAVENVKSDNRHIKSILNTYVNHKLSTLDYSNEDINNVADEFAHVFKSYRKRSYSTNHSDTAPVTKKPYFDVPSLTEDDKSLGSKMNIDVVNSPNGRPPSQTRKSVTNVDAVIRLCKICDTSGPGLRSIKCRNSHVICQSCLEEEIRLVMASEKMCLSCPEESCKAAITLDCLMSVLSPLIVDLLSDNLRLKEQRASAKAIRKMQGLVVCPCCSCPGLIEDQQLHFVCATCKRGSCCYCKRPWLRSDEHDCCFLLSFVGTECLRDIYKQPQNWNMGITPFNKNFVQINVPLNSAEGSAVAAYCAKTSSGKSSVIQIFRIQNVKLWEKYILKRKHVEDEIGASELKENFLFHGTKAENIVKICGEGFDIRVPTSNGALLGKGIYFSIAARYSEKYADKSGRLFLSRVICGWSQAGQRQLTRPLYDGLSKRMYDSCVDNVSSPTMYTVFDNSQCYPEYLVQFSH